MKQLSEEELNQKIARFLNERFEAHPELNGVKPGLRERTGISNVVSRVKNISRKITDVQNRTLFQGH